MGVVAELILVRHGQSVANVALPEADAAGLEDAGIAGRDTDIELTALGVEQATAFGGWLRDLDADRLPEVVVTSPYRRARETWRIAAEASGRELPTPATDDRLVDRLTGELELLTRAAITRRFPDEAARLEQAGEYHYRPPGGETFSEIADRLRSFLTDLNRAHAGRRVTVVAHDAVVLMTRAVIEELDWDDLAAVQAAGSVKNASITRFDGASGRLRLGRWNDVDHLPEVSAAP